VSLHSGIIGTASHLSKSCLLIRTKIISVIKSHAVVRETVATLSKNQVALLNLSPTRVPWDIKIDLLRRLSCKSLVFRIMQVNNLRRVTRYNDLSRFLKLKLKLN
jgi:hypothetical protein